MRVTRTPVKAAYRPTPVPPAPLEGRTSADHPNQHRPDRRQYDEADRGPATSSLKSVLIPAISIACLILALVAVGFVVLYRAYDVTPVSLLNAIRPVSRLPPSTTIAAAPEVAKPVESPTRPPLRKGTTTSRAWSMWQTGDYAPFDPAFDLTRGFQTVVTFPKGFDIIDGATVQSDQTTVRMSGIAPLPASTICLSAQVTKFACGLQARASLSILISGDKLLCYPDVSLETQNPVYLCQTHGRDVGLAQIEAGFALPSHPSVAKSVELAETARHAQVGAWNGDWTIIPPGAAAATKPGIP